MALTEKNQQPDQDPGAGVAGQDQSRPRVVGEVSRPADEQPTDRKARRSGSDSKADSEAPGRLAGLRRRRWTIAVLALAILAALAAAVIWWLNARHYESTDDAFIQTRTVPVSAQIAGQIVAVPVTDNQKVAAGAPLLRIDPRDYRVAVEQAQAELEQARAQVANVAAQIAAQRARLDQAHKQVSEAQALLQYARQQDTRAQRLVQTGAGSVQAAQQAHSDLMQKQAAFAGAQANATAADKQLAVLSAQQKSAAAQVDAAKAALDKAKLALSRTTIHAPQAGHIANLTAAVGGYAQPGQALMAIVPLEVWVVANFKETQLADMRPGQPVDIEIDAYPDKTFHGHVASIQAGSGVAFSLLPPENATGNFVKVVQRVPVKIVFNQPPKVYLGPGMSVVPSVKVR